MSLQYFASHIGHWWSGNKVSCIARNVGSVRLSCVSLFHHKRTMLTYDMPPVKRFDKPHNVLMYGSFFLCVSERFSCAFLRQWLNRSFIFLHVSGLIVWRVSFCVALASVVRRGLIASPKKQKTFEYHVHVCLGKCVTDDKIQYFSVCAGTFDTFRARIYLCVCVWWAVVTDFFYILYQR